MVLSILYGHAKIRSFYNNLCTQVPNFIWISHRNLINIKNKNMILAHKFMIKNVTEKDITDAILWNL